MFDKFLQFWKVFWQSIKTAYNKALKEPIEEAVQPWRDTLHINLLDIFITKLNNLTNSEATFDVVTDSALAEPLQTLAKSLEDERFTITAAMLADGDFFVFPATDKDGGIIHSYLPQARVRILQTDQDGIKDACAILDWKTDAKTAQTYFLLRRHTLYNNGNLTVAYNVVDASNKTAHIDEWADFDGVAYTFEGAQNIGFGRYKSPKDSRGLSPVYGVQLNFGCGEIERKIENDLRLIEGEYKNGKSVIFTDPRNLLTDKEKGGYRIAENIIPIQSRAGQNGSNIDIFNPAIRSSEHFDKLVHDLSLYEKQIGTSKGILTDNETAYTATATAIRRANADTLALIDKIRNAIDVGNEMTLKADAVFLNIADDLWTYSSDWYDPFDDPSDQWARLIEAKEQGAAETVDLVRWMFPKLTPEEIDEKLHRIGTTRNMAQSDALDRILNGR